MSVYLLFVCVPMRYVHMCVIVYEVCMCDCVFGCFFAFVCVWVCMLLFVHMFVFGCFLPLRVFVCICVFVCVFVCMRCVQGQDARHGVDASGRSKFSPLYQSLIAHCALATVRICELCL